MKKISFIASPIKVLELCLIIISIFFDGSYSITFAQLIKQIKTGNVISSTISPNSEYIVCGYADSTVRFINSYSGEIEKIFNAHMVPILLSYDPFGKYIVCCNVSIIIFDAATFEPKTILKAKNIEPGFFIKSISFSPDGKNLISGTACVRISRGKDFIIQIWKIDTMTNLQIHYEKIKGHIDDIKCLSFSPDGNYFISGSKDNTIKIWQANTCKLVKTIDEKNGGHKKTINSILFNPDGKYFISGSEDGEIKIWQAPNYELIETIGEKKEGHKKPVNSLLFSPDGKYFISGSDDMTIKIWDATFLKLVKTLNKDSDGYKQSIISLSFAPNGTYFISRDKDKIIKVWDFKKLFLTEFPPDLYAQISFTDKNHNDILDADEKASINLELENRGKGDAFDLEIKLIPLNKNEELTYKNHFLGILKPGQKKSYSIPLIASVAVKTMENKFTIQVTERNGYGVDPIEFTIFTRELKKPDFKLLGVEIDDDRMDMSYGINVDQKIQRGEQIEAIVNIQNQGEGDAKNLKITLNNKSESIDIKSQNEFTKDVLASGDVFSVKMVFSVKKNYSGLPELPLSINIKENYGLANISDLPLNISLDKIAAVSKPVVIQPKFANGLKRAEFSTSTPKIAFKSNKLVENVEDIPSSKMMRKNALAVIIGMPNAKNALNDASLMKEYFQKVIGIESSDIIQLPNENLKRNDFIETFEFRMKNAVDRDTELFIYYSGHGIADDDSNAYILPVDGNVLPALVPKTCYPLADLYASLHNLNAKHTSVVLDACFSGTDRENHELDPYLKGRSYPKIKKAYQSYKDITIISSSTDNQTSWAMQETNYGLFSYYFAAALKGFADRNGDHQITLGELRDYVTENVLTISKNYGREQVPTFWLSDGNYDKVFLTY